MVIAGDEIGNMMTSPVTHMTWCISP